MTKENTKTENSTDAGSQVDPLTCSADHEYGPTAYFRVRIHELEKERNKANYEADYYRTELASAHELLGRVVHQTSERWDSVRLTKYYPTDNLHGKRNRNNPKGA